MIEPIKDVIRFIEDNMTGEEIQEQFNKYPHEIDYNIVNDGYVDFLPYDMYKTMTLLKVKDTGILTEFEKVMYKSGKQQAVQDLTDYYKRLIGRAVKEYIKYNGN